MTLKKRIQVPVLFLISIFALFSGCRVKTDNGKIPQEHVEAARIFQGEYRGTVAGVKTKVQIEIKDDGLVIATVKNENGKSEFIPGCTSQIGQLKELDLSSKDKRIKAAIFEMNLKACGFVRNNLEVRQIDSTKFEFYAVQSMRTEWEERCTVDQFGQKCRYEPIQVVDQVLQEVFTKK